MDSPTPEHWYAPRDVSSTFVKGLSVLAAFDEGHARRTLPEIGKATGLDRAAVRRLVITLVDQGLLEKTGKTFALTPKILTYGASYLRGNAVGSVVQPVLNRHSQELGREIALAALSDGAAVYVAQASLKGAEVSFGFTVGSRLPVLHTAIGRMLLAYGAQDSCEAALAGAPLTRYTANSLMDRDQIAAQVALARDQGYALVRDEFERGIAGLAVPVGAFGQSRTVIGVSAPAAYFDDTTKRADCLGILQLCANDLAHADASAL